MTMAMAIRWALGKSWEPTPQNETNVFTQINVARMMTILPRTMTPEPQCGCQSALPKTWGLNLYVLFPESRQWNEPDHLEDNITHTPNHESHIVVAHSPEDVCKRDSTMGCSPEACWGPDLNAGMPVCWKDQRNPFWSADVWTVSDKVVFGFAICARFYGSWKLGAKRRSNKGFDGQRGENAVWWALMHILEEWAKKSQWKRKRTDDTTGPTLKEPTTYGPPEHLGPSGQLRPSG